MVLCHKLWVSCMEQRPSGRKSLQKKAYWPTHKLSVTYFPKENNIRYLSLLFVVLILELQRYLISLFVCKYAVIMWYTIAILAVIFLQQNSLRFMWQNNGVCMLVYTFYVRLHSITTEQNSKKYPYLCQDYNVSKEISLEKIIASGKKKMSWDL